MTRELKVTLDPDGETVTIDGDLPLTPAIKEYMRLFPEKTTEEAIRDCLRTGAAIISRGGFLEQDGETQHGR